jgi:hypothetical protein
MARRSRSDGSSPNSVLVIFLVLFILMNIGFGVWIYTLFQERDKWDNKAQEKEATIKAKTAEAEWNKYKFDELVNAIGIPEIVNKSDVAQGWNDQRKAFREAGKFQGETDADEFNRAIDFLQDKLGRFGEGRYPKRFADLPDELRAQLDAKSKSLAEAEAKIKTFDASLRAEQAANAKEWAQLKQIVNKGNADSLAERQKQNADLKKAFDDNDELRGKIAALVDERDREVAKMALIFKQSEKKHLDLLALQKNPNRNLGEPHALLLDISSGKPLWDLPRGKITRVDDEARKVYIDKGLLDGVKPGLTFLVFAKGWLGRGEGPLKATIEVVRVENDHTSQCKVNSYYDVDGSEIPAGDATPGKIMRDASTSLKEGDHLFNMFWGSHVALAGVIDPSGTAGTDGPAQMDALKEFMRNLERMGMIVDAYVDLQDGTIVGDLSTKTNYLIRGAMAYRGSGGEKGKGEPVAAVNTSIKAMQAQAIERGLFIISSKNFAAVSGFRQPSSFDSGRALEFRPQRTSGGNPAADPNAGKGEQKQSPPMPPSGDVK